MLQLGVSRQASLTLLPGPDFAGTLLDFIKRSAAAWGEPAELARRAGFALTQCAEVIFDQALCRDRIKIALHSGESGVEAEVSYRGSALPLAGELPAADELLEGSDGALKMALFLIRRSADRLFFKDEGENRGIHLVFERQGDTAG